MTAEQETQKRVIIDGLVRVRQAILEAVRTLPPEKQDQVFLGVWSPADLIAHLVGWDHTNLQAISEIRSAQVPAFFRHRDRDWKTYNACLVERHKSPDFSVLLASAEQSHRDLIKALEALSGEEIHREFGVRLGRYHITIDRLLRVELSDEEEHLEQLMGFASGGEIR